jgi:hypothetical protein
MKCIVCGEKEVAENRKLFCGYDCYKKSKNMKEGRKTMRGDLSPSEYMEEVKLRAEEDRKNSEARAKVSEYFGYEPILFELDLENGTGRRVDIVQMLKYLFRSESERKEIGGHA